MKNFTKTPAIDWNESLYVYIQDKITYIVEQENKNLLWN